MSAAALDSVISGVDFILVRFRIQPHSQGWRSRRGASRHERPSQDRGDTFVSAYHRPAATFAPGMPASADQAIELGTSTTSADVARVIVALRPFLKGFVVI